MARESNSAIRKEYLLDEACDRLGTLPSIKVCHTLAVLLDI